MIYILKDLIYIMPDVINLFLSGFIFMHTFNWINNKTQMDFSLFTLWSLFISFIIKTFYSLIHSFLFVSYDINSYLKITIYIITGFLLPFLIKKILKSKAIRRCLYLIDNKSINSDIWDDIIDYNSRTMMKVYIKNSKYYYIGSFKLREENGLDSWIVLIDYATLLLKNNEVVYNPENDGRKSTVVINLRDIERIEIIYDDKSDIWEKLNK